MTFFIQNKKKQKKTQKGNAGNRTQNLLFTRQTQYHYATPPGHIIFF